MPDTLLHPDDSGEVVRLPGETSRLITAAERERLLGEQTENLGRYLADSPSFEAIPRKVFDIDDTVRYDLPKSLRMDLKALHATIDGELRPAAPGPFPVPLPPDPQPAPTPEVKLRRSVPYVLPADRAPWRGARHARPAPLWTRVAILVGGAMVAGSLLGLGILWMVVR